jgi:hypothetical protein
MAFTKTTNWFAPSPLPTINFPFKHSEAGLLLGRAILGFCPEFKIELRIMAQNLWKQSILYSQEDSARFVKDAESALIPAAGIDYRWLDIACHRGSKKSPPGEISVSYFYPTLRLLGYASPA